MAKQALLLDAAVVTPPTPPTPPDTGRHGPGALLLVIVGMLIGALLTGAVTMGVLRVPGFPLPSVAVGQPAPATTSGTGTAAPSSRTAAPSAGNAGATERAAIQAAIQKASDEQAQAIARNDSTLMRDTATAQHYDELVKVNADLQAGGVTAIKLVRIEWGPIDLRGASAQAVTFETWQATYADGTTDQTRDENDYRLVLQGGAWLIAADDQPASQAPGAPGTSPQPTAPALGGVTPGTDTSRNWSGYAAGGGSFTSVSGTWTVPDPAPGTLGVDATWVGIGGVNSRDLIQAGTQTTVLGGSSTQFGAWIEMLPQPSQTVPLSIAPGDSVTVSISAETGDRWLIAMKNNTTSKTYSTTVTYASSHSSAEWIEEAPSGGRSLLPLDAFGTINFTAAQATKDGKSVNIRDASGKAVTMINSLRQPLA